MSLLPRGIYPASVTPFLESGEVDFASVARLMAYFEAAGCSGVVVGGTNGEGPSLSAVERRDLCREAVHLAGRLLVIQGIATASLPEAIWLCEQAGKAGASAALVMPPAYFRTVSDAAILAWFHALLNAAPIPIICYNFPKMTGITLSQAMIEQLAQHDRFGGVKDSSGDVANLTAYRSATHQQHALLVGNETLLLQALEAGWTGSISGAANVVPQWLSRIVLEWDDAAQRESARAKFALILPILEAVRSQGQPAMNKCVLHEWGLIARATPRLPLTEPPEQDAREILSQIEATLGLRTGELGLVNRH